MARLDVEEIINLEDDQASSQFELVFPNGIPLSNISPDILKFRVHQEFTPPEKKLKLYEFSYKGIKIMKNSNAEDTAKEMEIPFRCDQSWSVYNALDAWEEAISSSTNGTGSAPRSVLRIPIVLNYFGTDDSIAKGFLFNNCTLNKKAISQGNYESNEPILITTTFFYSHRTNL